MKIDVRVKRPGVTIRSPKQMVPARHAAATQDPKVALGETLRQPRVATDLSLRVTTLSARQSGTDKLKAVIVAEVAGLDEPAGALTWGYEVRDGAKVVADGFDTKEAPAGGSPTREALVSTTSLAPGSYVLRFAATDANGRRGSVERPINIGLQAGSNVTCSDLFIGEAVAGRFKPHVTFAPETRQVVAFVELYGGTLPNEVEVEFMLRDAENVVRTSGRVPAPPGQGDRRVVQAVLRVAELPVGTYQLSAQVLIQGRPAAIVRRSIVIGV